MLEEAAHEAAILNSSSAAATSATILNLSSAAAILPPPFWIPAVQGKRLHFAQACGMAAATAAILNAGLQSPASDPLLGVVLAEAVVEKEVGEWVVEVGPQAH